MKPSAHTLRGPPASKSLPAHLFHTLFVFCATSLMLAIAVITFLFVLLLKSIVPAPGPRRPGRHVTFLEPSVVIPPSAAERRSTANLKGMPSLSLTATPRLLEPATPDVAEEPLRALARICGFLASSTARAWRGEALPATPPLAGLASYLDAVHRDLECINEMGEETGEEGGNEETSVGEAKVTDRESAVEEVEEAEAAAGESAGAGASADADADAHDEPGLVGPDQAKTHARRPPPPPPPSQLPTTPSRPPPPLPPSKLPATPLVPDTSTSTSTPTPPAPAPEPQPAAPSASTSASASASTPTPPAPEPEPEPAAPSISADTTTPAATTTTPTPTTAPTTTTQGPRKRKDAVRRTTRPSIDPSNADALADADDAAVRAAALLSRVADLGAGLFDGAVRERGAALWTAFSRHRPSSPEVPVTRFAAPGERS